MIFKLLQGAVMLRGWINGILGIWLFITPFFGASTGFYAGNDFIVGLIVGLVGLSMVGVKGWQGWLSAIVGLWLIISAFIPGLHLGSGVYANNLICGILGMIAGFAAVPHAPAHPAATAHA
jgi:hypothetical protein